MALITLATLACGSAARAAVAVLGSSSSLTENSGSNSSRTLSYTVPAGNNRLLVVTSSGAGNNTNISSVTWNGSAMTQAAQIAQGGGTNSNAGVWYVLMGSSASSTTANVTVTYGGNFFFVVTATTFSGVDQTTPVSGGTTGTSATLSVGSASGNMVIDAVCGAPNSTTANSGQTALANSSIVFDTQAAAASYASGASSVSMGWSSFTGDIVHAGVSINQVGATPAPTVSGVSPTSGSTAGGTSVTITGTNFTGASAVKFGSTNATSYTVNSATQITATSPSESVGTVDITVTTGGGASATSAADHFTYNPPLTATQAIASETLTQNKAVTSFTPVTGAGGTAPLSYSISPALPSGLSISSSTGAITGTPSVTLGATSFTVTVTDHNSVTASNTFTLTVNSAVTATQAVASKTLTQNHAATTFTPITGGGGTGALSYSISPALPTGLSLSSSTGAITGTPSVTLAATSFTVTVTDTNNATATNSFTLTVNSAVTATQAVASKGLTINQSSANFTPVTGGGGTGTLSYGISPALPSGLSISSSTGAISGSPSATSSSTSYTVTVTDSNNATASNTFTLTVNSATTATQAIATKTLTQNQPSANFTPVTGGGGTSPLSYSVSPALPTGLSISSSTGAITGSPSVTSASASYTVTVTDANSVTATNTFTLTVSSAVTATQAVASKVLTQNHAATTFTPITGGGGTGTLSYSISPALPTGLSISSSTGAITGTPSVTLAATGFTVTVTDTNNATATNSFTLTVNAATTATQTVASKGLTINQASTNFTPVTGGGGTGTLSYSISPALPAGLSISSSTGAITGSPSVTSSSTSYTVTVTDSNSATATNSFTLTVNSTTTATQAIATKTLTQNQPSANFTPVTGGGGTAALSYSISPALPTGLSISSSTGAITGSPSVTSASASYTVTVTDANSVTATNTFTLTVSSAVTATQAVASKTLTRNQPSANFTPVTGGSGTGTLSYSISPALPTGLSISSSTGAITGSPSVTSSSTSYTVTVTDTNSATATNSFTLTVNSAVTAAQAVATKTLTQNQPSANFTPVTGGGGTGTLSYSISPALPTGLSISSSTGAITGSPSVTLTASSFTVTVTDTNNATATNTFTLTVNGAVTATQAVASTTLAQYQAATAFTPVTSGGGTGTLSYGVSPALPTGLNLSTSTGAITGTPSVASSSTSYTVTVTDANNATASNTFSLTVNPGVGIAATSAAAVEGGVTGLYTVTRGSSSGDLTVSFQLDASSTATAGTDFTLTSAQSLTFNTGTGAGTVVIPDGSATATITLTALVENPNPAEAAETVRLNLVAGSGYAVNVPPGDNAIVTIAANSFFVTITGDSGTGSLRQAALNVNTLGGTPTITFDAALTGTITLTSGDLVLSSGCAIQGPGASVLAVNGGGTSRIFTLSGGSFTISGLTLTQGGGASSTYNGLGGAVFSTQDLVLSDCVLTGNTASSLGGALAEAFGTLSLNRCTFSGNSCANASAIYLQDTTCHCAGSTFSGNAGSDAIRINPSSANAALYMYNSTLSGNTNGTSDFGTALTLQNTAGHNSTAVLDHCTITGNTCSGSSGQGAVCLQSGGGTNDLLLYSTVVSGNTTDGSASDISGGSADSSSSSNLIGTGGGLTNGVNGNIVGINDPQLGALANNGGTTLTCMPLDGSPVINAGAASGAQQEITVTGGSGTYTLTFGGQTTSPLAYNASLSAISAALNGLSSIGGAGGTAVLLGTSADYTAVFGGTLADTTQSLSASGSGGATVLAAAYDQRGAGFPRLRGPAADIGAVEALLYTPTITATTTDEDTQSSSGLVITANTADAGGTANYKITSINGGTLYKNDGTTMISDNDYISKAEGAAGLKFSPSANAYSPVTTFGFNVQAALSATDSDLRGSVVAASITINPVADTPSVTDSRTTQNIQTVDGLVISRNVVDGSEVAFFKISNVTHGQVYLNDGSTAVNDGDYITYAQGSAGLKFTPATDFTGVATFAVQGSIDNAGTGLSSGAATASIAVGTVNPTPAQIPAANPITGYTVTSQTGLFDVSVTVTNTTAYAINGFRLSVDYSAYLAAQPSLRLYNSSSAPGVSPAYIDYPYPMAVSATVTVKLSFYTSTRQMPNPFAPVLSVTKLAVSQTPAASGPGVPATIRLNNAGTVLLEWASTVGSWYQVQYSDDMTNWYYSTIPVQASTTGMQWEDTGPPFTQTAPGASRFYRVQQIPAPTP